MNRHRKRLTGNRWRGRSLCCIDLCAGARVLEGVRFSGRSLNESSSLSTR